MKNTTQKRFISIQGNLDRLGYLLGRARQLEQMGSLMVYREVMYEAAKLAERVACGYRELVIDTTLTDKYELVEEVVSTLGITVERDGDWYRVVIPALIPGKHAGSCRFITDPLSVAMGRFCREHQPERLRECVICFRHVFDRDFPERAMRDHDNLEVKKVQDVIADKLMVDDIGLWCSCLHVTVPGSADCTEIYLMPPAALPAWLKIYPIQTP